MDDSFDLPLRTPVCRHFVATETCYSNRLGPQAGRPDANEIRQIFARIGLTDAFWDPQADTF
jgi:hypothetical protein